MRVPPCAGCAVVAAESTPAVAVQPPVASKPGLASFWPAAQVPVPAGSTVHATCVVPDELPDVAVTVEVYEPAVVGVPEITPVEVLMPSPGGRPVADHV